MEGRHVPTVMAGEEVLSWLIVVCRPTARRRTPRRMSSSHWFARVIECRLTRVELPVLNPA